MIEYYIDLGSSTIKVYKYAEELNLLEEHSIYFKNGFTEENGISDENKEELYEYFEALVKKYDMKYENTHIFVTGIFRNLNYVKKQELIKEFNGRFDLHFNIISHGIENYYLGKAMENDYGANKVMIINMGGKTTEIVTFKDNVVTDRKNLKIGVAELLNEFPNSNDEYSSAKIENIVSFVKDKIKEVEFDTDYDCAIFTGGELRFEKLTKYNLVENTLFKDGIHDYMIRFEDFVKGNENIFYKLTLNELYGLMPQNPKWMDGARTGAVLPQAIFEKASIKWIVPSDLNLINGVINDINS
jgi:exopolyphosphatase/pppGpp-phosphohydrolase